MDPSLGGPYLGSGGPYRWVARNAYRVMASALGKRKRGALGIPAAGLATALATSYKRRRTLGSARRRRPAYKKRRVMRRGRGRGRKKGPGKYWPRLRFGRNRRPVERVVRKFRVETTIYPQNITIPMTDGNGWQIECDGHKPDLPFQREMLQLIGQGSKSLGMSDWANVYAKGRVLACLVELFVEQRIDGERTGGLLCSRVKPGNAPAGGTVLNVMPSQTVLWNGIQTPNSQIEGVKAFMKANGEWKTLMLPQATDHSDSKSTYYMSRYLTPGKVIGTDYDPHAATYVPDTSVLTADNFGTGSEMHCEFKFLADQFVSPTIGDASLQQVVRIRKTYTMLFSDPRLATTA